VPSTSAERAFDAIIVAGPASVRLGGADKAMIDVGGRTLLQRALSHVATAQRTVVVGPPRDVDVVWCEERPAGGGPVAAFAAGLAHTSADRVVLLAVDLPFAGPAIDAVLSTNADLAVLADASGRLNYLCSAWHRKFAEGRLAALGDLAGASMRALLGDSSVTVVEDQGGWSHDCDTWEAIEAARSRATAEGI